MDVQAACLNLYVEYTLHVVMISDFLGGTSNSNECSNNLAARCQPTSFAGLVLPTGPFIYLLLLLVSSLHLI